MTESDNIYKAPLEQVPNFRFDDAVARVFPDMIQRSVPGYAETVAMSGIIAGRYAQPNTHLYDLGCSLGAVTLAMRHALKEPGCKIIGIDNSQDMIARAQHYIALDEGATDVELLCADIVDTPLTNASVTALNFVLQFIAPEQRLTLLEKICFSPEEQALQQELHWDFKRANGYSDLEIAQKRSAIEKVLIPETEQVHRERLKAAGFSQVVRWYQCFNFVSFLAIK